MDDAVIAALIVWEVAAVATPLPTLSTMLRRLPVSARWGFIAALAAVLAYHLGAVP